MRKGGALSFFIMKDKIKPQKSIQKSEIIKSDYIEIEKKT